MRSFFQALFTLLLYLLLFMCILALIGWLFFKIF